MELAGGVMEELAKGGGPRTEVVSVQCQEFMQAVKVPLLPHDASVISSNRSFPIDHSAYLTLNRQSGAVYTGTFFRNVEYKNHINV